MNVETIVRNLKIGLIAHVRIEDHGFSGMDCSVRKLGERLCHRFPVGDLITKGDLGILSEAEVTGAIIQRFIEYERATPGTFEGNITNKEYVLKNVLPKILNAKEKDRIGGPYVNFFDFIVAFQVRTSENSNEAWSILTHNRLRQLGIDMDITRLFYIAKGNARRKEGYTTGKVTGCLKPAFADLLRVSNLTMYVCTNDKGRDGAGIILQDDYFARLAEDLDEDLYVAISSPHEVLAFPMSCGITEERVRSIADMIGNIYDAESEPISNNVYIYSRELHRLAACV